MLVGSTCRDWDCDRPFSSTEWMAAPLQKQPSSIAHAMTARGSLARGGVMLRNGRDRSANHSAPGGGLPPYFRRIARRRPCPEWPSCRTGSAALGDRCTTIFGQNKQDNNDLRRDAITNFARFRTMPTPR